jgi:hypothetical protein
MPLVLMPTIACAFWMYENVGGNPARQSHIPTLIRLLKECATCNSNNEFQVSSAARRDGTPMCNVDSWSKSSLKCPHSSERFEANARKLRILKVIDTTQNLKFLDATSLVWIWQV